MEPIEGSETSAIRTKTPGNYPKENILLIEHGESLKSRSHIHLHAYLIHIFSYVNSLSNNMVSIGNEE